jgi:mannose-6-phosphate isomerase-like protein (cupin superfamily)
MYGHSGRPYDHFSSHHKGGTEMAADENAGFSMMSKDQGRPLWHLGALLNFKALGSETEGRLWALEGLADHHMSVPLHVHSREDELWYILEGEIRFTIADETVIGTPGTVAYIPKGVPHTFQIVSETARWFGVGVPAGLDQWFFETGEPAKSLTLPPPPSSPPDVEALVQSLRQYGTETLGPPPGIDD